MGLSNNLGKLSNMITSTGSAVGIAQSSPSYTLDVSGTLRATGAATFSSSVGMGSAPISSARLTITDGTSIAAYWKATNTNVGTRDWAIITNNANFGDFAIKQGNSQGADATSGTDRLYISASGNVGIGTSSPSRNLHVSSSGSETTIAATKAGTDSAQMGVDSVAYCGAGGDYTFRTGGFGSGNEKMRITSGGEVSINNTSTTARFNLFESAAKWAQIINHTRAAGQFFVQFQYNGSEIGAISGNASNTTYATSSDYRLKEDLKDFNGIDLVNKLSVYDFAWKSDNTRRMYGVLAHELSDIIPYAVNKEKDLIKEDGSIDVQGVDYSLITPLLVKAIQEQQAMITSLQDRLDKAGL